MLANQADNGPDAVQRGFLLERRRGDVLELAIGIVIQRAHEQLVLVAEGLVQAALVQAGAAAQVVQRRRLVALLPEFVHGGLEGALLVEFAGSSDRSFLYRLGHNPGVFITDRSRIYPFRIPLSTPGSKKVCARGQNIRPGFSKPLGSRAFFSERMSATSLSLRVTPRNGRFSRPMPCSAEIEPR